MFTLCGLIFEARKTLFRDYWSPFSIYFYFSSARNYLKKTNRGPCPTGTLARQGFISRGGASRRPSRRPRTLAAPSAPPAPPLAAAPRRRRTPPPDAAAAARRPAALPTPPPRRTPPPPRSPRNPRCFFKIFF